MNKTHEIGLGTLLRQLLAATDGDIQDIYDEAGVAFRPRFFPVVRHLLAHDCASVSEIVKSSGVSQPAITQTLNEMRRARLVSMRKGGDKRAREVRLTETGRAVAKRLEPIWHAVELACAGLDAELPEPLRATLARALSRLTARPFAERIRDARKTT